MLTKAHSHDKLANVPFIYGEVLLMGRIFALFLAAITGVVLLAACNSNEQKVRTSGTPGPGQPQQQGQAPVFADGVRRVTVTELNALLQNNEAVVIDVRTADAFNTAHVKGARLIPEAEVVKHVNELPKDKLIVTYCS